MKESTSCTAEIKGGSDNKPFSTSLSNGLFPAGVRARVEDCFDELAVDGAEAATDLNRAGVIDEAREVAFVVIAVPIDQDNTEECNTSWLQREEGVCLGDDVANEGAGDQ